MIKSITNFLIIFFIFQQLKSQISQIDQNGYNTFCDETLHMQSPLNLNLKVITSRYWNMARKKGEIIHFLISFKINITKVCKIESLCTKLNIIKHYTNKYAHVNFHT